MALPTPRLSESGKQAITDYLEQVVAERQNPATWLGATTAEGELYFDGKGEKVFGKADEGEVDDETLLQIFSTTKLVTTIAALQQVEQGRIGLDDSDALYKICPELGGMQVLEEGSFDSGQAELRDARTKMTLRMLLNHTNGLSYAFSNPEVGRYRQQQGTPEMWSDNAPLAAFIQPLGFDPGTRFCYGIGIDWAGIMVTRLSGLDLEEYFKKYIWAPCGVKSISFLPPTKWSGKGMAMTVRDPPHTGDIQLMKGTAMGRPMDPKVIGPNYMGGGGLFGTARDYLAFLRGLLRSADPSTPDERRVIKPETSKLLFIDSIPADPKHRPQIMKDVAKMAYEQHIHDPAVLTDGTGDNAGYGPALFINKIDSKFGRKAGSGCWDGAAKTYYWMDPTTGVAGVCFTNLLSHNPDPFNRVLNKFERILYDHLG